MKAKLEEKINKYNEAYRCGAKPLITDQEYDALINQYQLLYGEYTPKESHFQCLLPYYSPSLKKYKLEKDLLSWAQSYEQFVVMDKLDGMSIIIQYNNVNKNNINNNNNNNINNINNNIVVYTHGQEGVMGTNISYLLPYLNIPKNVDDCFVVRGELYIKKNIFEKYKQEYQSERNCISGVINGTKKKNYTMLSDFSFAAFEIQNSSLLISQQLEILKNNFEVPSYYITNQLNYQELVDDLKQKTNVPRDGKVIAADVCETVTNGLPLHKIAFKILGNTALTTVLTVEWNYSKHCLLKPRIHYNTIFLDGGHLSWCTGFNAQFIEKHQIGPGTQLLMTRSGCINPYIVEVVQSTVASMPQDYYEWNKTHCDIYGHVNDTVRIKRLCYFFKLLKAKFLAKKTIEKLYHHGLTTLQHYYDLKINQLLTIPGIKQASAERIITNIQKTLNQITLCKVMVGSCLFPHFGEKKCDTIINHCPTLFDICLNHQDNHLTINNLKNCPGIQDMAEQFLNNLPQFITFLDDTPTIKQELSQPINYVNDDIDKEQPINNGIDKELSLIKPIDCQNYPLQGQYIVFSGDKLLTEKAKLLGAVVEGDVTKRTTLLVVKTPGTMNAKEVKCTKLNIPIISLSQFKKQYQL